MRTVDDFLVACSLQEAAVELVSTPGWERHLRALATALRERCAVLAAGLVREIPEWTITHVPAGGLHLWVRPTADYLAEAARSHGVSIADGRQYFAAEPPGTFLRIGFAATAELAEGVRRLALAARDLPGR
ncbi:hypothetical protein EV192_107157 [Actinocrispum wychmicini]|uniref:Aminotransferase class I and II n=2 Tax=Actinocrispum wychmicini TaxID=1213861 RepID=A0A4R2JAD8_9PSEU|nr:hypothetical protein EV192_107157 [Actinocrispum wychmicini]